MKGLTLKGSRIIAGILLALALVVVFVLAQIFLSAREKEPIYLGPGVTGIAMLSQYYPELEGTAADTEIYILDSGKPGASALVLGGTHPNEPSGLITAVMIIENAVVEEGIVYVIPRTNNSAFTCTDPQEASPMRFTIETADGVRWFRFGSRATNPINQWPDPEMYVHASSGQQLSGSETRNINRTYPGRTDGSFTEKISYAVTSLIKQEEIDLTIDLHEAAPEYPTINALVAHEDAMELASSALINMQIMGMTISLEPSPENLHGLIHRELGDYTDTLAVLMETANPAQGRLRGRTDEALVVTGIDHFYERAAQYGRLYVPFDENGHPLVSRVARHMTGIRALVEAYNNDPELSASGSLVISGLPDYHELLDTGLGAYLLAPENAQ